MSQEVQVMGCVLVTVFGTIRLETFVPDDEQVVCMKLTHPKLKGPNRTRRGEVVSICNPANGQEATSGVQLQGISRSAPNVTSILGV